MTDVEKIYNKVNHYLSSFISQKLNDSSENIVNAEIQPKLLPEENAASPPIL